MKQYVLEQVECVNCSRKDYSDRMTRTTDNKTACLLCLDQARNYYKKGLLSSEELLNYEEVSKQYKKKVLKISETVRTMSIHYGENPKDLLKEVLDIQDVLAITNFLKVFKCCKIEEREIIINKVLNNFDLLRADISDEEKAKVSLAGVGSNGWYRNKLEETYYDILSV